jgi:hypothetical protein
MSKPDDRVCSDAYEESPGSRGCRVTPGGGDSKDSATEIYRETVGLGQLPQGWKGEVRAHQRLGN